MRTLPTLLLFVVAVLGLMVSTGPNKALIVSNSLARCAGVGEGTRDLNLGNYNQNPWVKFIQVPPDLFHVHQAIRESGNDNSWAAIGGGRIAVCVGVLPLDPALRAAARAINSHVIK